MFKKIFILPIMFFCFSANANECMAYKIKPKITITTPEYEKHVVQSKKPMNLLHGNVVATLVDNYDIVAEITKTDGGFCIGLKSVAATIGYTDFMVKIDSRHGVNTCSYKAILNHENRHIDAYISVVDDNKQDLYDAIYSAADSIMPIFVKSQMDADGAVEKMNSELQTHPDVVLAIQKIHADEEIKNKNIDKQENYSELKSCL